MGKESGRYLIRGRDYLGHIDGQIRMYDLLLTLAWEMRKEILEGNFASAMRTLSKYEHKANQEYLSWNIPDDYLLGGGPKALRKLANRELTDAHAALRP